MNKRGPIIIIEDDEDDQWLLTEAFKELKCPNTLLFYKDGETALAELMKSDFIPFLILSDINMPKLDGFALRDKVKMDAKLQLRCTPYIFFSTAVSQDAVIKAYSQSVQGFFVKASSLGELKKILSAIIEYWTLCATPNSVLYPTS